MLSWPFRSVLSLDLKVGGNNGKVAGQAKILSLKNRRPYETRKRFTGRVRELVGWGLPAEILSFDGANGGFSFILDCYFITRSQSLATISLH